MRSYLSKLEYIERLKSLSTGLKEKKNEMNSCIIDPYHRENSEGLFAALLNEALTKKPFYNNGLGEYIVRVEVKNFKIWGINERIRPLRSEDSIFSGYFLREYDSVVLRELFENCGVKEDRCFQGDNSISINFNAKNLEKANEFIDGFIEKENKKIKS